MVETRLLKTFCTVAQWRSFTKAGRILGLSQPTVSQQIQALEQELSVPLLVRSHNVVRLTPAGEIVLQCAQQVIQNLERARRLVAEHSSSGGGRLVITAPRAACDLVLPGVIAELRLRAPKIQLSVLAMGAAEAPERLRAKEIDFAFLPAGGDCEQLGIAEVGRDEIIAAMSPAHPLGGHGRLQAAHLRDHPCIVPAAEEGEYALWETFMLESGVLPRLVVETDSLAIAKRLALDGITITIAPHWAVLGEVQQGKLRAIGFGRTGLWRKWLVAYSAAQPLDDARRTFLTLCRDRLAGLLAGASPPSADPSEPTDEA